MSSEHCATQAETRVELMALHEFRLMTTRGTPRVRIPEVIPNTSLTIRLSRPLIRSGTPVVVTDLPLVRTDTTLSTIHLVRHVQNHKIPTDVPLRTRQHFQRRETSSTTRSQQSRRGNVFQTREDWCSSDDLFSEEKIVQVHQWGHTP